MLGNRYSQHSFAQVPSVNTPRSSFDRSFAVKDTFDFDYLVPIFIDEILPGDTANVRLNHFARLATQKVPIMDNMYLDFYFFFVPSRLVWNNWEKFNGAQDNPDDSTDYLLPQMICDDTLVGSLFDHMGLPTGLADIQVNALPFRAYNLIWNEWFRDQDLQDSVTVEKDDGPDLSSEYALLKGGKKHDYFTSARPWPQKGPALEIPMAIEAPVVSTGSQIQIRGLTENVDRSMFVASDVTNNLYMNNKVGGAQGVKFGTTTGLEADLSLAAGTINELRQAFQIQSLLELDARGGTRYVEILLAHWNVTSPDFRLQRPEYLGGGTARINSHAVPQTAPTSGSNPQAQLAAYATSSSSGNIGFSKSFVEHGYVLGLVKARADITYQQGLNRMWSRRTRYDFFWPKLQQLGEQSILRKEIYMTGDANEDNVVFGYQERYAEYRYKPSEIRGVFRSTAPTSIDQWHLAEEFGTFPELNETFIESSTPIDRAIAVPSEPHLLFDAFFQYKHARVMLAYSVPVSLGRF